MIKRSLLEALKDHLFEKEISLVVGPRQAGKTTLLRLLEKYLEDQGKTTVFLNLDVEADKRFFSSQEALIQKIQLEAGIKKAYVFIDEIQRKENAGVFLKGIYDMNLPYKFIASGSGSLELKEKIHESLAGRKRLFELGTLSFEEFVNYKTNYRYEEKLHDFFYVEEQKTRDLLEEYLAFGGYPRVVIEETHAEKRKVIDEIYRSYIDHDISLLLGVKKSDEFINLVKIMASQIGQLINHTELSSTLGISLPTVKEYLWYLEKTFILRKVTPYFRNIRKEIIKNPIYYFYDLGLRNHALGVLGNLTNPIDKSYVFKNFIFNQIREKITHTSAQIHFWRTKAKAEVDFIIDKGLEIIPLEAKYKKLNKEEIDRSFHSFLSEYHPTIGYIINLIYTKKVVLNQTTIQFLPYYELLFTNFAS